MGEIFREIFRGIFPGKMYEKSAPGLRFPVAIDVGASALKGVLR
jgi:hypothetical protein